MIRLAGTVKTRTIAGATFRCSNRVAWHLRWTIFMLRLHFPKARLVIYQTCYHTGVDASAGTHDYDAVFDVWIAGGVLGADPWRAQRFLRRCGWAAYFRHTGSWAARAAWHIHMISIPPGLPADPTPLQIGKAYAALGMKVGKYIDGGYTTTGVRTLHARRDHHRPRRGDEPARRLLRPRARPRRPAPRRRGRFLVPEGHQPHRVPPLLVVQPHRPLRRHRMPSKNPLKYLPAKGRRIAYGLYAAAAVTVGALLVAGVDVGKAPEVLVYLGGALGVTAASNVDQPAD